MDPVNPELLGKEGPGEDQSIARVGMKAAATIHTSKGLWCKVRERFPEEGTPSESTKELATA
ncbi:MAG: hypothetical protein SGPRY_007649 [Prymnesium sp.]